MSSGEKERIATTRFKLWQHLQPLIFPLSKVAGTIPHYWSCKDPLYSLNTSGKLQFTDTDIGDAIAVDGRGKHLNYGCCDAGLWAAKMVPAGSASAVQACWATIWPQNVSHTRPPSINYDIAAFHDAQMWDVQKQQQREPRSASGAKSICIIFWVKLG